MRHFMLTLALVLFGAAAHAAPTTYTYLTHPDFLGKATGLDGLWGTADDTAMPGFNTRGAASNFVNSDGPFSFVDGFVSVDVHPSDAFGNGTFDLVSESRTSEFNAPAFGITNLIATGTLSSTGANSGTYNLVTQEFVEDNDSLFPFFNSIVRAHNVGVFLSNGQNPASVFANPDLVTSINFIIARLPVNWAVLNIGAETASIVDATTLQATGITSIGSFVRFSTVPVPAALPLLAAALAGLGALRRRTA